MVKGFRGFGLQLFQLVDPALQFNRALEVRHEDPKELPIFCLEMFSSPVSYRADIAESLIMKRANVHARPNVTISWIFKICRGIDVYGLTLKR